MKKIGIFYAAKADKTSWVAEKVKGIWCFRRVCGYRKCLAKRF